MLITENIATPITNDEFLPDNLPDEEKTFSAFEGKGYIYPGGNTSQLFAGAIVRGYLR